MCWMNIWLTHTWLLSEYVHICICICMSYIHIYIYIYTYMWSPKPSLPMGRPKQIYCTVQDLGSYYTGRALRTQELLQAPSPDGPGLSNNQWKNANPWTSRKNDENNSHMYAFASICTHVQPVHKKKSLPHEVWVNNITTYEITQTILLQIVDMLICCAIPTSYTVPHISLSRNG